MGRIEQRELEAQRADSSMRHPDWEQRLDAHFTAARTRPFAWGEFDCAMAICQGAQAITGIDVGADLRGSYSTAEEAAALIALHGATLSLESPTPIDSQSAGDLGTLAASIAAAHGFAEVRPSFAKRGDVVLVDNSLAHADPSVALGTVDLSGRYAWCVGERGFVRVPMQRWRRAWHIA